MDSAQYKERTNDYDFDMTHYIRVAVASAPATSRCSTGGMTGVTEPGTRNWMGMNSPAAEAMIQTMLTATDPQDFIAATHALDRVLTTGSYVVPIWYSDVSRIAHAKTLHYPDRLPIYGDWLGFQPDVWWYAE